MRIYLRQRRGQLSEKSQDKGKVRRNSLYLLYVDGKKRTNEFLKLYLYDKPKTNIEKEHNKETMLLAEAIKAQKILDVQSTAHGFVSSVRSKVGFLAYFKKLTEKRFDISAGNYGNWFSTYQHLIIFLNGSDIPFEKIDDRFLESFKEYLQNCKTRSGLKEVKLNLNTAQFYFNKVRAAIKDAYQNRMMRENPCNRVKSVKGAETHREY